MRNMDHRDGAVLDSVDGTLAEWVNSEQEHLAPVKYTVVKYTVVKYTGPISGPIDFSVKRLGLGLNKKKNQINWPLMGPGIFY